MKKISEKSITDLEFDLVLQQAAEQCATELGKKALLNLRPHTSFARVQTEIEQVHEYNSSYSSEHKIPNHGFESIDKPLGLLGIENSKIEIESFQHIAHLAKTAQSLLRFFKKTKTFFPQLYRFGEGIPIEKTIPKEIDRVIDRFGEVRNQASDALQCIRKEMDQVRGKISQSFGSAMSTYHRAGFLDDIKETVVSNRRVLAVKAMYRRKVKGSLLGSSKTGSIVYIEPQAVVQYSQEMENLMYDEQEEIDRILRTLTDWMRPHEELLLKYQRYATEIDVICAKALYAQRINGVMPKLNDITDLDLKHAYHPLLYLSNKEKKQTTYPQTIHLNNERRILVISGPNAGGKSITLKTIGLLQLMVQSGFLVPVNEQSHMCIFENIMTDIGDHQSIENELSTYSYRLKNMNRFLRKINPKSLLLIDEFGTGSDPELGGALAEIFLEVFYEKKALGVITTHYTNLKLLADELPHAANANMQFDRNKLTPTFQLVTGEAGSSFTFEVAEKNGIPYGLINRAKKKIERGKVRFDATLAKMQRERSAMAKNTKELQSEALKRKKQNEKLEALHSKVKAKLESYQNLFDQDQRMIVLGNKVNDLAESYYLNGKKRPLVAGLLQIVELENAKRKKQSAALIRKKKAAKKKLKEEIEKKIEKVRVEKKDIPKPIVKKRPKVQLFIGDQVRLFDGKAVGTIDSLEKNKAFVNYGTFTTQVHTDELELVQRSS
jgi:DNA mismatch repair protein MutS2